MLCRHPSIYPNHPKLASFRGLRHQNLRHRHYDYKDYKLDKQCKGQYCQARAVCIDSKMSVHTDEIPPVRG